jgi:ribosome maturation factor RimP
VSPSSTEERVKAIAEKVAIDQGLELVHAEVAGPDNKPIVRIFIDKPAGVTHQDCSEVSLHLGTILDVEDFIHSSYSLAKVKTKRPIGNQRNFRGRLIGIDGDEVLFDDKTNGRVRIPLEAIVKANLDVDFDAELRHR